MIPIFSNRPVNKLRKLSVLIPLLIIICCTTDPQITGTVDTTDTGKAKAMLYKLDGTPADSAIIKVFGTQSTVIAFETVTDSNGSYTLKGLNGIYSIWAEKDSLVAFQDSVFIFPDTIYAKNDTLRKPGSITAKVGLQPGDNYQTVTVNVLGTYKHSNVDKNGWFTFNGMPQGDYNLSLSTTLANYSTTFYPIKTYSDSAYALKDTLWLIYTGIPLVMNIKAEYDTLKGIIKVYWDSVVYNNFQEYLVFRQPDTAKTLSTVPIGIVMNNVFYDTINNGDRQTDPHFRDTNSYTYQYRVKIRNKFDEEGKAFGYVRATVVPPSLAANAGKDTLVLTNTNVNLHGSGSDRSGKIVKYEWAFGNADTFYQTTTGDTTIKAPTVETDSYRCFLKITDNNGKTSIDAVVISAKKVLIITPTANATISGMYKVQGVADPTLSKIQVKIADNSWVVATGVASWSADIETRTLFPHSSSTITVQAFSDTTNAFASTFAIQLSNTDPIIGSWTVDNYGNLTTVTFAENGALFDNQVFDFPGRIWSRNGGDILFHNPSSSSYDDRYYHVNFIDYGNLVVTPGLNAFRTDTLTFTRQ